MNIKTWRMVGVVCCGLILGCGQSESLKERKRVTLGAILPMTGKNADAGNAIRVGLELSVQRLNKAQTNFAIHVACFDTKSEPRNSVTGYRFLRDSKDVDIFFTTISENGMAIKPIVLGDEKILMAILSHTEILNNRKDRVFRLLQTGSDEANFLSDYILKKLNAERVSLCVFNAEAGLAFTHTFRDRLGDRICESFVYGEDGDALKNIVSTMNLKNLDCVAVVGYTPAMGTLIRLIRERGYDKTIVANIGFNNPSIISAAGDASNTVWFNDYVLPYGSAMHAEFSRRALRDYNTSFTSLSYIAYGAVQMIGQAILENVDEDTVRAVQDYFNSERRESVEGIQFEIHGNGAVVTKLGMRKL